LGGKLMAGRIDFRKVETPTEFQQICERLLARRFSDFHPVSQAGGDGGIDGFATWGDQFFQFTHTQRNVPLQKVRSDLEKVRQFQGVKRWYFICSQSLSIATWRFVEAQRAVCPFEIVVWDGAVLKELISKHADLVDEFFPEYAKKAYEGTRTIRKDLTRLGNVLTRVREKPPKAGDAMPGGEVSAEEAVELRQMMAKTAEEQAARKKRKPTGRDYGGQFGEFNSHYDLSAYDRLPREKFADARRYIEKKLYAGRNAETRTLQRSRFIKGTKAIQRKLAIPDSQYRQILLGLTGKDSLAAMDNSELSRVFKHFQGLQGQAEAAG